MADDAKAEELLDQLRDSFAAQIRSAVTDLPAHQALQLADALCTVQLDMLAGMRVHYKSKPTVDGEAIAESWRTGSTLRDVMAKHSCSRVTAYKYHPNKAALQKSG